MHLFLKCPANPSCLGIVSRASLKRQNKTKHTNNKSSKLAKNEPKQSKLKMWLSAILQSCYSQWKVLSSFLNYSLAEWGLFLGIPSSREILRTFVSLKGCVLSLVNVDLGRRWKRCDRQEGPCSSCKGKGAGTDLCLLIKSLFWLSVNN